MRRDEARGPADALRAQKPRKPGPRSSYLWDWGAGTHAAAAATSGGVPAQLAQLGPRKEGGRWDSPPGTQPVCRVGRGGAGQPG